MARLTALPAQAVGDRVGAIAAVTSVAAFVATACVTARTALAAGATNAADQTASATGTTGSTILAGHTSGAVAAITTPAAASSAALESWLRWREVLSRFGKAAVTTSSAIGSGAPVPASASVATDGRYACVGSHAVRRSTTTTVASETTGGPVASPTTIPADSGAARRCHLRVRAEFDTAVNGLATTPGAACLPEGSAVSVCTTATGKTCLVAGTSIGRMRCPCAGLRSAGGRVHSVSTVGAVHPVAAVAANAEEEPAVAACTTTLAGRHAVTPKPAVSEEERIASRTTVGAVTAAAPQQSAIATVACRAGAISRGIDTITEQPEQWTCRTCRRNRTRRCAGQVATVGQ